MLWELTAADAAEDHSWRSIVLGAAPHPFYAKDTSSRFVLVNRRFADLFHISAEQILGKTDYDVFSPDIADAHFGYDQTALQTLNVVQWEEEVPFDDGPHSFLWSEFPLITGANELRGIGVISTDLTAGLRQQLRTAGITRTAEQPGDGLSDTKNRAILSALKSHIAVVDAAGTILEVNDSWLRFARENGIADISRVSPGVNYLDVCRRAVGHAAEAGPALRGLEQVLAREVDEFSLEYPCHGPARQQWFEVCVTPIDHSTGRAVISHSNITRRVQIEQQLKRSEEYHRALIDNTMDIVGILRSDGTLSYVNKAVHRNLGYEPDELIGKNVLQFIHPDDRGHAAHAIERTVRSPGTPQRIEFRNRHKDGGWRLIESIGVCLLGNPSLDGVVVSSRDNTARREAEAALRERDAALEKTNEKLQALTARILVAEEEERRRISRELHDDLNQNLAILALDLGTCIKQVPASAPAVLRSGLRAIQQSLADVAESVRQMAHQLHPAVLDELGITIALRSLCEEFSRRQAIVVRFVSADIPDIDVEVRANIYRITQEALRNISRHADARRVMVAITANASEVKLRIRDWGSGFDLASPRDRGGLGLISMEERARMLGGAFQIWSEPGKGVRITVSIPLRRQTQ